MGGRRCGVSALKEANKARSSETMEYQVPGTPPSQSPSLQGYISLLVGSTPPVFVLHLHELGGNVSSIPTEC